MKHSKGVSVVSQEVKPWRARREGTFFGDKSWESDDVIETMYSTITAKIDTAHSPIFSLYT